MSSNEEGNRSVLETNLGVLKELFASILALDDGLSPEVIRKTNFDSIRKVTQDNWDSLAHVSLVAAIESEFGITLNLSDYERLTSFKAIELLLSERGL